MSDKTRMSMHPSKERPELDALLARAREAVAAMTPEERDAMYQAQRESWVRGNLDIDRGPDARRTITGDDEPRWPGGTAMELWQHSIAIWKEPEHAAVVAIQKALLLMEIEFNNRTDRILAALREPSDELLEAMVCNGTLKLVAKSFLRDAAEWLKENVK